ncbi:MAG: hypothetical protein G01um101433_913 [Parcubacteria group bacterium Gr01-1014_33]|nr:MAG: hypothetical protein G01um101433_913 [Parcubacteria group bacterium Gr01-1014_33]
MRHKVPLHSILALSLMFLFLVPRFASFASAQSQYFNPLGGINSIEGLFNNVFRGLLQLLFAFGAVALIFIGFKFLVYAGNPTKRAEAQKALPWVLLGLALVGAAMLTSDALKNTFLGGASEPKIRIEQPELPATGGLGETSGRMPQVQPQTPVSPLARVTPLSPVSPIEWKWDAQFRTDPLGTQIIFIATGTPLQIPPQRIYVESAPSIHSRFPNVWIMGTPSSVSLDTLSHLLDDAYDRVGSAYRGKGNIVIALDRASFARLTSSPSPAEFGTALYLADGTVVINAESLSQAPGNFFVHALAHIMTDFKLARGTITIHDMESHFDAARDANAFVNERARVTPLEFIAATVEIAVDPTQTQYPSTDPQAIAALKSAYEWLFETGFIPSVPQIPQ